jgi:hypothetical protein
VSLWLNNAIPLRRIHLKNSRREFAKKLVTIAATPLLTRYGSSASSIAEPQAQTPEQPSPVAEALTEVVRLRYGKNLDEEQIKSIKQSIDQAQRSAERLKQIKLANGDEPAFVFSADLS